MMAKRKISPRKTETMIIVVIPYSIIIIEAIKMAVIGFISLNSY